MKVINVKNEPKGCSVCTFDLQYDANGLKGPIYRDHKLMNKDGKYWISGPARQYEKDGIKKYFNFLQFEEDPHKWAFEKDVMTQLKPHMQTTAPF